MRTQVLAARRSMSRLVIAVTGAIAVMVSLMVAAPASGLDERPGGRPVAPTVQGQGPVIFTTAAELDLVRSRVQAQEEPFFSAWLKTLAAADAALGRTYVPRQENNHTDYFNLGKSHAQDVRSLALAYHVTSDQRYADKGREILALWAEDALAGPDPAAGGPHAAGLVIGRVISIFADGYALLWADMPEPERGQVEAWFEKMVAPIKESRRLWQTAEELCDYGAPCTSWPAPWLDHQEFNNHLGAQNLGLMAIGHAVDNRRLVIEATQHPRNPRNLRTLIEGTVLMAGDDPYYKDPTLTRGAPAVQTGEIYDRYRTTTGSGLHYAHIHLRFLALQADIVANNRGGRDWFSFVGRDGENLQLPFEFYSEFLVTGSSSARGGYYERSYVDYGLLPMYEIAHREYPQSAEIRNVLASFDRVAFDSETFGWTLLLTDGADGIPIPDEPYPSRGLSEWTFDRDSNFEEWAVRKASSTVVDGSLNLKVTGRDPGIVSPNLLGLGTTEFNRLEVRMRNGTQDTTAEIFFITDDDTTYDLRKSTTVSVQAGGDYVTYVFDLSQLDGYEGRLRQLRFDPVLGATTGTVSIDSVRLLPPL